MDTVSSLSLDSLDFYFASNFKEIKIYQKN